MATLPAPAKISKTMASGGFNTELLMKVQRFVIDTATENGQLLDDQFASKNDFKQFIIALTMRMLIDQIGMTTEQAFDAVMGAGRFQALCDESFEKLQAKANG
jgi:hypothetical protein